VVRKEPAGRRDLIGFLLHASTPTPSVAFFVEVVVAVQSRAGLVAASKQSAEDTGPGCAPIGMADLSDPGKAIWLIQDGRNTERDHAQ
jgi:hypothetical protein